MRWARFKTMVLIFLAGRLARWADLIERRIDYREALAEESFTDGETRSGVPEHWARLTARRPPEAWLDLIRDRAPDLLSNVENELLSREAVEIFERETIPAEDEVSFVQDGARRPRPETFQPEKKIDERRYEAEQNRGATWLKRLRFQPPGPVVNSETVYLKNPETRRGTVASAPEREPSATGDERRRDVAPGMFAKFFKRSTRKANRNETESRWANVESAASRQRNNPAVVHAQDRRPPQSSQTYAPAGSSSRRNDGVKVPAAKAEQKKTPSLRLLRSSDKKHSASNRVQQNLKQRAASVTRVSSLELPHVQKRSTTVISLPGQSQVPEPKRRTNAVDVRGVAGSRKEFASLDFPASEHNAPVSEYNAPLSRPRSEYHVPVRQYNTPEREYHAPEYNAPGDESGESVWPALPAAPDWETADEVAATQREAERIRRLELEQRGALWNA